ncbi:MAG: hypothetical protein ACE5I7_01150, partial [Candidatus Binatia bacterium]
MAERSLWFESHLFADRAGRRARQACEQLGPQIHAQILAAGDRLAAASPSVAQQFYRHAPTVRRTLGAGSFHRWVALGQDLLTREPSQREAALAYFSVAPQAVARVGVERLRSWCDTGQRVAAASRRLGATFFQGTVALVDKVGAATLAEWARHGLRLYGRAGW